MNRSPAPLYFFRRFLFLASRSRIVKRHRLRYLLWECTNRCNLDCACNTVYCRKEKHRLDMPAAHFLEAIDTIPKMHRRKLRVIIAGGEPLLRPDLPDIGSEISKRGISWGMVTNGTLYSQIIQDRLSAAGLGYLYVHIDGMEAAHDRARNNIPNFRYASRCISLALADGRISVTVLTLVTGQNIHQMETLYRWLSGLGVKSWRIFTADSLDGVSFRKLLDFIASKRRTAGKIPDIQFGCEGYVGSYEGKVRNAPFFCRSGINIGAVYNDGGITGCLNMDKRTVQGNIYESGFYEVWQNKFILFRNRDWLKVSRCQNCEDFRYCLGNGLHYRRDTRTEVKVCHLSRLLESEK
ncbi:MAG: radical SAM protein [Bacteroidales bacterium]|nr:radical SAM protein [Bacteroidales bacterium]MDD4655232.1 radical SAM protein [Bacteroidales bacterium]